MYCFANTCRICRNSVSDLIDFNEIHDNVAISDKLFYLTPEMFETINSLPRKICRKCCRNLDVAYNFKLTCTESNFILQRYETLLSSIKNTSLEKKSMKLTVELIDVYRGAENVAKDSDGIKTETVDEGKISETDTNKFSSNTEVFFFLKTESIDINPEDCEYKEKCDLNTGEVKKINENVNPATNECNFCGKSHLITPTERQPFERKEHNQSFCQMNNLVEQSFINRDIKTVEDNKKTSETYECDICKKVFFQSSILKAHGLVHSEKRPNKCNECGKSFKTLGHLKSHLTIHNGIRPYKCDQCGKAFSQSNNLTRHKYVHTRKNMMEEQRIESHRCETCGKDFAYSSSLKIHSLTHNIERLYKCEECRKTFKTSGNLKSHIVTHTGERPYTCNICKKTFTQISNLKRHGNIHTAIRQYQCEMCNRIFEELNQLNKHVSAHNETCFQHNMHGVNFTQT